MSSEVERAVEAWIADHVAPEGYEADDDAAERLAARCVDAVPYARREIEAEIGPLTARMAAAVTAATEHEMMKRDGRRAYSGVELPVEGKEEILAEEAEAARRKAASRDAD